MIAPWFQQDKKVLKRCGYHTRQRKALETTAKSQQSNHM